MAAELHWPALAVTTHADSGQLHQLAMALPAGTFTTHTGEQLMVMLLVARLPKADR